MKKKAGVWLLAAVLMMNVFSLEVLADTGEGKDADFESSEYVWVNPIYEDVVSGADIAESAKQQEARAGAISSDYLSLNKAAAYLRGQMVDRIGTVIVKVSTDESVGSLAPVLFNKAVEVKKQTAGDEGDYIYYNLQGYRASISYSSKQYIITYYLSYLTTKAQEAQVTVKARKVLASLGIKNKANYGKIKAIYDYICKNVKYDTVTLNDSSVGKYSAYQALVHGTAVCQGYASLFYRLAKDAGVSVRVIPGTSWGELHAWNIAKVGGYYYNLDSTWDSGRSSYAYFLKGQKDFPNHVRDQGYCTAEFYQSYPTPDVAYRKGAVVNTGQNSLSGASISGVKNKSYTGKKRTLKLTVRLAGVTLKKGRDYTVSYNNNVNIGKATVICKGKGQYSGKLKRTFRIMVKKGAVYTVGDYKYRITSVGTAKKKGTVKVVGIVKSSGASIKTQGQVTIGGQKFKVTSISAKLKNR